MGDQRVDCNEIECDRNLLYWYHGQPFTGVGFEVDEHGKVFLEISFADGMREGRTRVWYPSGQLKVEYFNHRGTAHGTCQEWYESGALMKREVIEHGILLKSEDWERDGTLISKYELKPGDQNYELLLKWRKTED